jgi:hypothetical protein
MNLRTLQDGLLPQRLKVRETLLKIFSVPDEEGDGGAPDLVQAVESARGVEREVHAKLCYETHKDDYLGKVSNCH